MEISHSFEELDGEQHGEIAGRISDSAGHHVYPPLQAVDLWGTNVTPHVAEAYRTAILSAMGGSGLNFHALTRVEFGSNPLGAYGISTLAPALATLPALESLSLSHCGIDDGGGANLLTALLDRDAPAGRTLRFLSLASNEVGSGTLAVLASVFEAYDEGASMEDGAPGSALEVFDLTSNKVTRTGILALAMALEPLAPNPGGSRAIALNCVRLLGNPKKGPGFIQARLRAAIAGLDGRSYQSPLRASAQAGGSVDDDDEDSYYLFSPNSLRRPSPVSRLNPSLIYPAPASPSHSPGDQVITLSPSPMSLVRRNRFLCDLDLSWSDDDQDDDLDQSATTTATTYSSPPRAGPTTRRLLASPRTPPPSAHRAQQEGDQYQRVTLPLPQWSTPQEERRRRRREMTPEPDEHLQTRGLDQVFQGYEDDAEATFHTDYLNVSALEELETVLASDDDDAAAAGLVEAW